MRHIATTTVVFLVVIVLSQLFLPGLVEHRIEAGLRQSLGDVQLVRADVKSFPAYQLLGGRLGAVNLDVRRVALGDLTVDAVFLDGRNLVVDMGRLLTGGGVHVRSADSLRATFVIAEDDLNRYFWSKVNRSKFFHVTLERGHAVLQGSLNLLGKDLQVRVQGVFQVVGGTQVSFVPQEVTVENTRVPQVLLDMIASEWGIVLDLNQQAIPLVIDDLLVEDGQLLIYGRRAANG